MTSIDGLLPGVEFVRIGTCGPEEYEQHGDHLLKGARSVSQVIVKPATGFEFRYEITSNCYRTVRVLPAKQTFIIEMEVNTADDLRNVEAIKRLASVISVTEKVA